MASFSDSVFADHSFSFADHKAITKNLHVVSSEKNVDALKSQACRDVPTLLGYTPSYQGKLRKKRKKEGEPSEKAEPSEGRTQEEESRAEGEAAVLQEVGWLLVRQRLGTSAPRIQLVVANHRVGLC